MLSVVCGRTRDGVRSAGRWCPLAAGRGVAGRVRTVHPWTEARRRGTEGGRRCVSRGGTRWRAGRAVARIGAFRRR